MAQSDSYMQMYQQERPLLRAFLINMIFTLLTKNLYSLYYCVFTLCLTL